MHTLKAQPELWGRVPPEQALGDIIRDFPSSEKLFLLASAGHGSFGPAVSSFLLVKTGNYLPAKAGLPACLPPPGLLLPPLRAQPYLAGVGQFGGVELC